MTTITDEKLSNMKPGWKVRVTPVSPEFGDEYIGTVIQTDIPGTVILGFGDEQRSVSTSSIGVIHNIEVVDRSEGIDPESVEPEEPDVAEDAAEDFDMTDDEWDEFMGAVQERVQSIVDNNDKHVPSALIAVPAPAGVVLEYLATFVKLYGREAVVEIGPSDDQGNAYLSFGL